LKIYDLAESEKVKLVNASLEGKARNLIITVDENELDTMDKLHKQLKSTFGKKIDWYGELLRCKQKPNESFRSFSIRVSITAKQAGCVGAAFEKTCLEIIRNQSALEYKKVCINLPKTMTFDQVVEHVLDIENSGLLERATKRKIDVVAAMEIDEEVDVKRARIEPMDVIANQLQYLVEQGRRRDGGNGDKGKRRKSLICYHCAKDGHSFNDCNSATKKDVERVKKLLKERKLDFQDLKLRNEQYHRELGNLNSTKTMAHKSGHPSSN
jgi:hypothetical protein